MPDLPLGKSAYERMRGSMPHIPVVNYIVEKAPTEKGGMIYQSRRPFVRIGQVGDGPIWATQQRDGVLNGARITVSGTQVYASDYVVGEIGINGPISMASNATRVLIAAGGNMVSWDGSTFKVVEFPDNAPVTKIAYLGGYFIAIRKGTQRWYFSVDGDTWDGLDYAAAESNPDILIDAIAANDILVLIGTTSTEFWVKTGNADLPFQAIQQRLFEYGAIATGCAVAADNTHFWIGNDAIVYRAGNVPEPISDDGQTALIQKSSIWQMYEMLDERHKLLIVRLDDRALVFDITSGEWSEFASYGYDTLRILSSDETVFGDAVDGSLWAFGSSFNDEPIMERRLAGGFPIDGGSVTIDRLRARVEVGQATDLVGDYVEPVIEMRFSDDLGKTWSDWEPESLGEQGDYRQIVEWRALGSFDHPGAMFEFRVTDPISARFTSASINDAGGGRA